MVIVHGVLYLLQGIQLIKLSRMVLFGLTSIASVIGVISYFLLHFYMI